MSQLNHNHKTSQTASVFMNGKSQAVRIPKEYRFNTEQVFIYRNENGDVVLTEKKPSWASYFEKHSSDIGLNNFMQDREQDIPVERDIF